MLAPTLDPDGRDPAAVAPTDSYHPDDPVWIHRGGQWRSGVVMTASAREVTVTYRPTDALGTAVDTVTARYVIARAEADPWIDRWPATGEGG
jgi:hypothetical protein